jgi:hypothetical protein
MAYPDSLGHFLRVIGPDTVTAGVSTTLSSSTTIGATSISTAASIPAGSKIQIDTGTTLEYAITGTPSGAGPYTIPIATPATGLTLAHNSAVAVVAASSHSFKQNPTAAKATYSISVYDTTATLGYTSAALSDLGIKVDSKGALLLTTKWTTMPGATQSTLTPTFTQLAPLLGWQWSMVNAGATSTRGISYDVTIKRTVEAIHAADGLQSPREIFQGALEVSGSYKAIFENQTDLNLYLNYTQTPTVATFTQPITAGGSTFAIAMSKSGWVKGTRELSSAYVQASFSLEGVYNATDGGAVAATFTNFQSTAY